MDAPLGRIDVVRHYSSRPAKPHGRRVDRSDLRRINGLLGGGVHDERRRPLQRTTRGAMGRGNVVGYTHHLDRQWNTCQRHLSLGRRVLGGRRVLCTHRTGSAEWFGPAESHRAVGRQRVVSGCEPRGHRHQRPLRCGLFAGGTVFRHRIIRRRSQQLHSSDAHRGDHASRRRVTRI